MTNQQIFLMLAGSISIGVLAFRLATGTPAFKWCSSASPLRLSMVSWYLVEACTVSGFVATALWCLHQEQSISWASALLAGLCVIHIINLGLMYAPSVVKHIHHYENHMVALAAATAGAIAASLNASAIFSASPSRPTELLLTGAAIFLAGFFVAVHSNVIATSRSGLPSATIHPRGMFRYLCCPIHFGVLVQWLGMAIASGSAASAVWLIFAASSIIPSAIAVSRWQHMTFPGLASGRKIVIPMIL